MEYKLTAKIQHSKKCPDGRKRNLLVFFLNGVQILKQKVPFDDAWDHGWQNQTSFDDVFLLDGRIHQTRTTQTPLSWWRGPGGEAKPKKIREVKFPVSKKILGQFNIPKDQKICLTNRNPEVGQNG
jgi:hypothetical protein